MQKTQTCSGGSSTFERILLIKYLQPFGTAWKLPLSFWWAQYKHKQYDYTSHSASATGYSPARSPAITTQQNVTENDLNIHICSRTTISNAVDINCSWLGGGVIAFFLSNAPDFFPLTQRKLSHAVSADKNLSTFQQVCSTSQVLSTLFRAEPNKQLVYLNDALTQRATNESRSPAFMSAVCPVLCLNPAN